MKIHVGVTTLQMKNLREGKIPVSLPDGAVIRGIERIAGFLHVYWTSEVADETLDEFEVGSP